MREVEMIRASLVFVLCAALGSTASAQRATYTFFGESAWPCGPSYTPALAPVNVPRLGTSFRLNVAPSCSISMHAGMEVFLITGFSRTSFGALRLPFDVSVLTTHPILDSWGGTLHVSADWIQLMPWGSGMTPVEVAWDIPDDPLLVGLEFYQQVLGVCTEGGGSGNDWVRVWRGLSEAGRGRIGF
jgi:hypothetical protein